MSRTIALTALSFASLFGPLDAVAASVNEAWQMSSFDGAPPSGLHLLEIQNGHVRLEGCGAYGGFIRRDAGVDKIENADLGMPPCTANLYREHNKLHHLLIIRPIVRRDGGHLVIEAEGHRAEFESISTIQAR